MLGIGKSLHIRSHFRHQYMQNVLTDPIDLFAALHLLLERMQMPLDLSFQVLDRTVVCINEAEEFAQKEAMVLSHFGGQSRCYLLLSCTHISLDSPR